MGVHGHVAEDVVKDVGFGGVFERVAAAQPGGGGKAARGQHLKEGGRGHEAADGGGIPAGAALQLGGDGGQVGQPVIGQAERVEAVEILLRGVLFKLRHAAADQLGPGAVLLGGVGGVVLFDQEGSGFGQRHGCGH
jgi:hypothetical protein